MICLHTKSVFFV